MSLKLYHIKDGASCQSNPILVGDDDLARVETAGGKVPRMYGPKGVRYLNDIRPYHVLGDFGRCARAAVSMVFLWLCQVDLNEGLRKREVILSKHERPVAER